jgi:hypothetical protein
VPCEPVFLKNGNARIVWQYSYLVAGFIPGPELAGANPAERVRFRTQTFQFAKGESAMKLLVPMVSIVLFPFMFQSQSQKPDLGLPELHTIKLATLEPSYGCRSRDEFRSGYRRTALFLSQYSDDRNSPDLLFNGACGSEDYFQASTAGDDMSLIADLGDAPLADVTAQKAFNFKGIHAFDLYSRFMEESPVVAGHTYAILINKRDVRGLVIVHVSDYVPNKRVELQYAVKEYQLLTVKSQAEGFNWSSRSQAPCLQP